MTMMKWPLYIYLFFIFFTCQFRSLQSIQCCRDYTCTDKLVDCPSNACFKLSLNLPSKMTEERGCMSDLVNLFPELAKDGSLTDDNGDHCQKLAENNGGSSICKCTTSLCNSSTKTATFSFFPVLIFISCLLFCIHSICY